MRSLLAMTAAFSLVAGCSATPAKQVSAPTPPAATTTSGAAPSAANSATSQVDGITVKASMPDGAAPSGEKLSVATSPVDIPAAKAQVAGAQTVRLRLGDSGAQPTKPITLTFDLSDKPDLAAKFTGTVVPVVVSASETDADELDMFKATWDPATKTATAVTPHLSDFKILGLDVGKALAEGFQNARGQTSSACRDQSAVTVGSTKYTLTAEHPGPVAACLQQDGNHLAVTFDNATNQHFTVRTTMGGTFTYTDLPTIDGTVVTALSKVLSAGAIGVVPAKGGGRIDLAPGTASGQIGLRADPAALQLRTLVTGLSMLGVDLGKYEAARVIWDCGANAVTTDPMLLGATTEATLQKTQAAAGNLSQCMNGLAGQTTNDKKLKQRYQRIGTAASLFTDLPSQLLANVTGAIGEFTGDNKLVFTLTSTAPSTSAKPKGSSAVQAYANKVGGAGSVGKEISPGVYQLGTSAGDKKPRVNIVLRWKTPDGSSVSTYCTEKMRVVDASGNTVVTKSQKLGGGCTSGGNWSVNIENTGTYRVILDLDREGDTPLHDEWAFTVVG